MFPRDERTGEHKRVRGVAADADLGAVSSTIERRLSWTLLYQTFMVLLGGYGPREAIPGLLVE